MLLSEEGLVLSHCNLHTHTHTQTHTHCLPSPSMRTRSQIRQEAVNLPLFLREYEGILRLILEHCSKSTRRTLAQASSSLCREIYSMEVFTLCVGGAYVFSDQHWRNLVRRAKVVETITLRLQPVVDTCLFSENMHKALVHMPGDMKKRVSTLELQRMKSYCFCGRKLSTLLAGFNGLTRYTSSGSACPLTVSNDAQALCQVLSRVKLLDFDDSSVVLSYAKDGGDLDGFLKALWNSLAALEVARFDCSDMGFHQSPNKFLYAWQFIRCFDHLAAIGVMKPQWVYRDNLQMYQKMENLHTLSLYEFSMHSYTLATFACMLTKGFFPNLTLLDFRIFKDFPYDISDGAVLELFLDGILGLKKLAHFYTSLLGFDCTTWVETCDAVFGPLPEGSWKLQTLALDLATHIRESPEISQGLLDRFLRLVDRKSLINLSLDRLDDSPMGGSAVGKISRFDIRDIQLCFCTTELQGTHSFLQDLKMLVSMELTRCSSDLALLDYAELPFLQRLVIRRMLFKYDSSKSGFPWIRGRVPSLHYLDISNNTIYLDATTGQSQELEDLKNALDKNPGLKELVLDEITIVGISFTTDRDLLLKRTVEVASSRGTIVSIRSRAARRGGKWPCHVQC